MTNVKPRRNLLIQSMVPMVTAGEREGEGGGGSGASRESGVRFQALISRKWIEITLSVWYTFSTKSRSLYRLGQVSELYGNV